MSHFPRTSAVARRLFAGAAIVVLASLLASCSKDKASPATEIVTETFAEAAAPECPKSDGSSPATRTFSAAPPMCIDPAKTYTVSMETTEGTMTFQLDASRAPNTVNNFVFLARYHYFDGISLHRIIKGFMIQGGDPTGTGGGGPGYAFADELPDQGEYKIGSLAMANSGANTNGSQFFIITGDAGVSLTPNYSLFGQLTSGDDVMRKIEALGMDSDPGTPSKPVSMTKVTVTDS